METVAAAAVLLALTFAFFAPVLQGKTFSTVPNQQRAQFPWRGVVADGTGIKSYPQTDQAELSHPWQVSLENALAEGTLPFWNPDSFAGGHPHFANGSSGVLYPPRLLAAWTLDADDAHVATSMLHVFLAGFFMYLLLRAFGTGPAGGMLGAVSWMLGSFTLGYLHLEVLAPMSAFIPLTILAVRRAMDDPSAIRTVLAGLSLGLVLIAGHVLLLFLVWVTAVGYGAALAVAAILREPEDRRSAAARAFGRLAGVVAISLGIAAVVLIPTGFALRETSRDPFTYDALTRGFLIAPSTFLHVFRPPEPFADARWLHELSFVGTVTAAAAVVGIFLRRQGAWLGRVLLGAVFAVSVGGPVTWVLYHAIPGFDVIRPYSRLLIFWTFGVALLGGLGFDAVVGTLRARLEGEGGRRVARLALAAGAVVAVAFTAQQLGRYGRAINPPFREGPLYPRTPLVQALENEVDTPGRWPGRVLPVRVVDPSGKPGPLILHAAQSLVYGIDSAAGYDSTLPRRVAALVRILEGTDPALVETSGSTRAYKPTFTSERTRFDLLDRMGITTIIAPPEKPEPESWTSRLRTTTAYEGPDGRILRLDGASSEPILVYRAEVVPDGHRSLLRFVDPAFDLRRSVILERPDLEREGVRLPPSRPGTGRIVDSERGVNSARIEVETDAPGWLVVADSWGPGWSTSIDGLPAPVLRANYAKRAVHVPAGRSVVQMRYVPPGFVAGAAITLATLGLASGAIVVSLRRRLRRSSPLRRSWEDQATGPNG